MRPEPDLVITFRRLTYLEKQDELSPRELRELNNLRRELGERWPAVSEALAMAYLEVTR
jgi:hypothetical protein